MSDGGVFRHEVEEARRYGIPIIVLVDTDKQLAREVIDKYMESGFSWLFDEQAGDYFPSAFVVTFLCLGHILLDARKRSSVRTM